MTTKFMIGLAGLTGMLSLSAPAQASDASAMCEGWAGKWRVVANSERAQEGSWTQDLSDGDWRVELTGPGKCRFFKGASTVDFDVDTTHGSYDVTNWTGGKPAPVDRYDLVSTAIENPRSWRITVQWPRRSETSSYTRMVMTMAGDLFAIELQSAGAADAPYFPRSLTVHRRLR